MVGGYREKRENQVVKSLPTMLSSQVITDEEELHKMSMECEPPLGGLPPPPPLSTVVLSPFSYFPFYHCLISSHFLHLRGLPLSSLNLQLHNFLLTQTRKRNPSPTPSAVSSASSTPSHYSTGEKFTTEEKHRLPQSLLAAAPNKFGEASIAEI